MPYAIECQGNIIQLYDPIYHQKIEDQEMEILRGHLVYSCPTTAAGSSAAARSSSPAAS